MPRRFPYLPSLMILARRRGGVEKLPWRFGVGTCLFLLAFECQLANASILQIGHPRVGEAHALLVQRKWPEAVVVLRNIYRETGESSLVALDLARALLFLGRREEALSVLTQALQHDGKVQKGEIIKKSRVISRQFLTKDTFQIYQDGINLLTLRKFRPAREKFEKALEQEPSNVEVLVRIGQCLTLEGDYDSAAERLRLAKKLNPYEPEIQLWLGRSLHQRGELSEAVLELKSAYQVLKGSELAPVWLAEALSSAGQAAAAVAVLEKDAKEQPLHLMGMMTLARLKYLSSMRDNQALWAAKKDLQVALSRFDKYAQTTPVLLDGDLNLDLRKPDELKTEIQTLLQRVEARLEQLPEGSSQGPTRQ